MVLVSTGGDSGIAPSIVPNSLIFSMKRGYCAAGMMTTKPLAFSLSTSDNRIFPFDFFTEILYPGRIVDAYEWSFDLQPQQVIDRQNLIQSAEQMREQTEP